MRTIRWVGLLFLLLIHDNFAEISEKKETSNCYCVTCNDYTFSTIFNMNAEKISLGSIVKSSFHLATHYDSYDRFELYKGTGVCCLFCLGLFCPQGTQIEVYNENGDYEGRIKGELFSAEITHFNFYDALDRHLAIAYLDQDNQEFSLVAPEDSSFILAYLSRNVTSDNGDHWDVAIYHAERIPSELLKIFAAFVCDNQDSFQLR